VKFGGLKKIKFLPNWKKSSSFGKMLCPKKKKPLHQGDIAKLPNCQIHFTLWTARK
jgi:hypothetical protein